MTIVQLQYVLAVEEYKSINAAAKRLYVAQSSISGAIKDLEEELGIIIYLRNNRGITLTKEGEEFIRYAKNVIFQYNLLHDHYTNDKKTKKDSFRVSLQHSNFAAREFADIIKKYGTDKYDFSIIEGSTHKVINDVKEFRSEFGFIQINAEYKEMYLKYLSRESLEFHILGERPACVYLSTNHPLADKELVTFEELRDYPYLIYEQDDNSSNYFYEDGINSAGLTDVVITYDRGTMLDMVHRINAYTIGMGIIGRNSSDLVAVKLDCDDKYIIGYIMRRGSELSEIGRDYLNQLRSYL